FEIVPVERNMLFVSRNARISCRFMPKRQRRRPISRIRSMQVVPILVSSSHTLKKYTMIKA
ncbi:MAG: hypothetical protein WC623_24760, partial [Pedobacter sp.]|uniref:hypothetical protein n=1 Tax=Pedobacter sp. TaxID=1411316 RepID=UPI0035643684